MINKELRTLRNEARKSMKAMKRVFEYMDKNLSCEGGDNIRLASAFFKVLEYHVTEGDLKPENVHLAMLLRRIKDE